MSEENNEIWYWFKELVIELRRKNNEIMKQQNGVFVVVALLDRSINDYVYFNPHTINLTGAKCTAMRNGKHEDMNLKKLLYKKTSEGAK